MTIEEGLKLKPKFVIPHYGKRRVDIPDTYRNDLPEFLYKRGCRVGAEIGVGTGEFGVELCKAGLRVYGIDSYVAYHEYKEKRDYRSQYEDAKKNLRGYDYMIINKFSEEALGDFVDESLDFVYIDGNHALPHAAFDIFGWEQKVKRGGVVSGHDYCIVYGRRERRPEQKVYDGCHVRYAVDACASIMKVDKLYVLGKRLGKNRDNRRSWFWIKQ